MDTVLAFLISNCCFIGIIGYGIDPIITKICFGIIAIRTLLKYWDLKENKNILSLKKYRDAQDYKEYDKIETSLGNIIWPSVIVGMFFLARLIESDSFRRALSDTSFMVCAFNSIFVVVRFFAKRKEKNEELKHAEVKDDPEPNNDIEDDFLDL